MSRPKFPDCILPVNCIHRILEEQEYYDKDPERYEREQQRREEERQEEEREMIRQYERDLQRQQEQEYLQDEGESK